MSPTTKGADEMELDQIPPVNARPGWPKRVCCLACDRWFTSPHPGVRLCGKCHARRDGEA